LIISVVALVLALVGTAFSGGSKVPGKNGVKASDIAKGAVKNAKIAKGAVTSGKFFVTTTATLNFGLIGFDDCDSLTVPVPGIEATDHVLVTPPPGFAETFVLQGRPEPATGVVSLAACNNFGAGSGDADGAGGGLYKVLVIR
jgi:hypothetical protein